jgi:TolB protein
MHRLRGSASRSSAILLCLLTCTQLSAAEPRRLTSDGKFKLEVQFIGDGQELVYTLEEKPTVHSSMRLRLSDGAIARVNDETGQSQASTTFSRDGRRYAYLQNNGNLHVVLVMRDAVRNTTVTHDPGKGFAGARSPTMAPDGSRVVFAFAEQGGSQQLFSIDPQSGNHVALTDSAGFDADPCFSPDGKSVVFASTRDDNFEIYTLVLQTGLMHRLTEHPSLDMHPAWSPDGRQIAFTSLRDGNYEVYVMGADGSNVRRVTHHPERDDYAAWHPDGRRLAIVSERSGKHDLYLVNLP